MLQVNRVTPSDIRAVCFIAKNFGGREHTIKEFLVGWEKKLSHPSLSERLHRLMALGWMQRRRIFDPENDMITYYVWSLTELGLQVAEQNAPEEKVGA